MTIENHDQLENGQWRKGRKSHPCDTVIYFGVQPHPKCTGQTGKNQMYFDSGVGDNGSHYKTHKFCRWCAQMELDTAHKMTRDQRDEYRETI